MNDHRIQTGAGLSMSSTGRSGMWMVRGLVALGLICWSGALSLAQPMSSASDPPRQPNVILIMIDDLGWRDLGCYGNEFVDTPNIDLLAKSGVRFTDFYAAGAVCSPTRCAIQSGQNQARIGITAHIPGHWRPFERVITPQVTMGLPSDLVTIADAMKSAGYSTGYIGKWHLNDAPEFDPASKGYDFSAVINGPHYQGKYRVKGRPDLRPQPNQYRTDFEADLAIEFIKNHQADPFFLMVSPFSVHIPLGAMKTKVDKYRERARQRGVDLPHPVYAAMIEHCDDMVGRIVEAVEQQGLTHNTVLIFTSDNGGLYRRYDYREAADDNVTSMDPLRGEKGMLYEGGIRVPLIVTYPAIVQAGAVCDEPTISYDFFPTCVALAGGKLPANQVIDGLDMTSLIRNPASSLQRKSLFWHYPHYHHSRPASCIRSGRWKLLQYLDQPDELELFDLVADLGETRNLVSEKPVLAQNLKRELSQWRRQTLARMPIKNPGYDPERAHQWWNRSSGKPVNSDARKRFPPTELDQ